MKKTYLKSLVMALLTLTPFIGHSQIEDELGAWYMYFFSRDFEKNRLGFQGDIQHRNWDLGGDLEQLMLRGGLTYRPVGTEAKLTLGYANITSGVFGDSDDTSSESRIYLEALLPHKVSSRVRLTHRFRYEQRWVDEQDLRTRYRYNVFVTIPLNDLEMNKGAFYLSLYNELFINGQREIGDDREVEIFDRNRLYGAIGRVMNGHLKVQLGMMRQSINGLSKNQLQLSLHHNI